MSFHYIVAPSQNISYSGFGQINIDSILNLSRTAFSKTKFQKAETGTTDEERLLHCRRIPRAPRVPLFVSGCAQVTARCSRGRYLEVLAMLAASSDRGENNM
jgi:hypothetical protein